MIHKRIQLMGVIISSLLLVSCFGLFDSGSDHIAGNYETTWIDTDKNRSINKEQGEGVVPPSVFAIGHNEKFIVAKQFPYTWDRDSVDLHGVNYYIIEQTTSLYQDKPVYGPLNKKSFDSLCHQLQIKDIPFDMDYSKTMMN